MMEIERNLCVICDVVAQSPGYRFSYSNEYVPVRVGLLDMSGLPKAQVRRSCTPTCIYVIRENASGCIL